MFDTYPSIPFFSQNERCTGTSGVRMKKTLYSTKDKASESPNKLYKIMKAEVSCIAYDIHSNEHS